MPTRTRAPTQANPKLVVNVPAGQKASSLQVGGGRANARYLKMQAGGVMYPPQPSPIPIPELPDINLPTPKDVGDWLDGLFGKQPGTTTGGPDPNDPEQQEKWKKVGKRWDEKGKKED